MKHRNLCQEVLQIITEPWSTQWKETVDRFHAFHMWMGGNLRALFAQNKEILEFLSLENVADG